MGSEVSMAVLFSQGIRVFLICTINMTLAVFATDLLLGRRRSFRGILTYMVIKALVVNVLMCVFLEVLYPDALWRKTLYALLVPVTVAANWGVFYWTFRGGFLKAVFGLWLGEGMAMAVAMPVTGFFNFLEKRQSVFEIIGEFHPLDMLMALTTIVVFMAGYRALKPLLIRFRTYELRHKNPLWLLTALSAVTMLADNRVAVEMYAMEMVYAALLTLAAIYLYRRYRRSVIQENSFLAVQQRLMESHYTAVQGQIARMERCQRLIDEQMEEIAAMEAGEISSGQISEYLWRLRQEYQQLRAGMYCNDWMVDSVLFCKMERCSELGISAECSFGGYERGGISEDVVVRILMQLFDCVLDAEYAAEEKWMRLGASFVKNQLLIELVCGGNVKTSGRGIRRYVEQYGGSIWFAQGAGRSCIRISLPGKE